MAEQAQEFARHESSVMSESQFGIRCAATFPQHMPQIFQTQSSSAPADVHLHYTGPIGLIMYHTITTIRYTLHYTHYSTTTQPLLTTQILLLLLLPLLLLLLLLLVVLLVVLLLLLLLLLAAPPPPRAYTLLKMEYKFPEEAASNSSNVNVAIAART